MSAVCKLCLHCKKLVNPTHCKPTYPPLLQTYSQAFAEESVWKPCHSELSRLTTCSRNWQLDKETHHFEFFFQTHWDAIQTRQGTFIPVTSSGGLSHLHREKKSIKHMLHIFSWAEGHHHYWNGYQTRLSWPVYQSFLLFPPYAGGKLQLGTIYANGCHISTEVPL